MNSLTKSYTHGLAVKISHDVYAVRGAYEVTFVVEREERSFFRTYRPRYFGSENNRRPMPSGEPS